MTRKSRIAKEIQDYPHSLWISLCMNPCAKDFVQ